MDVFAEHMVKHKKEGKDYAIIAAIIAGGIAITIACFFAIMLLVASGINISGLILIVIAAAWYFAYLLINMRNLEYEYILTNNFLDIDKVVARRGRKNVSDIDLKEILICASADDGAFAHEYANTASIAKTIDATGDKANGGIYFIDYNTEGGRTRLLFQPSKKIREGMHGINPRCIHIAEEQA